MGFEIRRAYNGWTVTDKLTDRIYVFTATEDLWKKLKELIK